MVVRPYDKNNARNMLKDVCDDTTKEKDDDKEDDENQINK